MCVCVQSAVAANAATIRVDTTLYVECLTGGVSIIVSEETQVCVCIYIYIF